jgi:hypothetical protein
MSKNLSLNEDLAASMIRSQIGALQDLLYCLENNIVDGNYMTEAIKMLGRKNQQIIKFCEQMSKLESSLAVSFR